MRYPSYLVGIALFVIFQGPSAWLHYYLVGIALFVIFQGPLAWLHYPSNCSVAFGPSALKILPLIVIIFVILLTLMWPSIF